MTGKIESAIFRVRDLQFDPRARTIDVAGQKTLLDARSSSVFSALAERFGECVSKEELLRTAWPTQLVHENSLAKAISKLRGAIRGAGLEIVAAYGVGYILREVAEIAPGEGQGSQPAESSIAPAELPRAKHSAAVIVVLLVLLSIAVGILALARSGQAVPVRDEPLITHDAPDAVATILWVDDHPSNNQLEVAAFRKRRIAVHLAETTGDALKLLAMNRYQLVISDLGRGEDRLAGLKMIKAMRQGGSTIPVVIYTVMPKDRAGQEAQRQLAAEAGAADLAVTPWDVRAQVLKRLGISPE